MAEPGSGMFDLSGRIALVTGGSRGLGRALALGLAQSGADIVLLARQQVPLGQAAEEIRALGRQCWTMPFDLARVSEVAGFYQSVQEQVGPMDFLVNCAGINLRGAAHEVSLQEWQKVQDVNLNSVFELSKAFASSRIETGRPGKIVNIASLISRGARQTLVAYGASKCGVVGLTRGMAIDWAPFKINVNAIAPGYMNTEMNRPLIEDKAFDAWVRQRTPMGRWGEPKELVGAAVFLLSAASDFITGQVIYADGGWSAAV